MASEITHFSPAAGSVAVGTLGFVDTQQAMAVHVTVSEHPRGIVLLIRGNGLRRALHLGWPEAKRLTDEMLAAVAGAPIDVQANEDVDIGSTRALLKSTGDTSDGD